ncbi:MAG: hypothetical protein OZSIB_2883 [Candidatus Ozemobacter sibiricus]|jgi:hypothetical protein|uniref:Uncharacterized protein n=1 Tax=Candidatus Ozemobacter sibiricus TaxID=2268124 RepID=A0A367ZRA7_9BACT|nr:MAG: hypothetical protein OZSIB_2883 [Candidatus Ozemobacter sibiricus]
MDFLLKLKDLDRRVIFVFIALAVALPLLFKMSFPVVPGRNVKSLFAHLDKLEPGTRTLLSFDFDPASAPELHPAAVAVLVHMFRCQLKPVCMANWPVGGDMAQSALEEALRIFKETPDEYYRQVGKPVPPTKDLKKGVDYVNMGYKPGGMAHIKGLIHDYLKAYPLDKDGAATGEMPIFDLPNGKKFTLADAGLIMSFTAGTGGIEVYIGLGGEHKRPMAASCTSVNIPKFYTYLQTKQLIGLVGGLPGAAECEALIDYKGPAQRGMAPQSIAHLVIMLFIIVGNIAYLYELSKTKKA